MNCPDGAVEAVAEGPRAKIDELIAWCRKGPSGAKVANVVIRWEQSQNTFVGFRIRR
jgi:acylphosphatase